MTITLLALQGITFSKSLLQHDPPFGLRTPLLRPIHSFLQQMFTEQLLCAGEVNKVDQNPCCVDASLLQGEDAENKQGR